MGVSMGGLISALTAKQREVSGPNDIAGLIMAYPALCVTDDMHTRFPTKEDLPTERYKENFGGVENLYPKFFQAAYDLDLYEMMTGYTGKVLIIHGLMDDMVPFTASVKAIQECYPTQLAELVVIAGEKSAHGFEAAWIGYTEGVKMAADAMMNAMENWQTGYKG